MFVHHIRLAHHTMQKNNPNATDLIKRLTYFIDYVNLRAMPDESLSTYLIS